MAWKEILAGIAGTALVGLAIWGGHASYQAELRREEELDGEVGGLPEKDRERFSLYFDLEKERADAEEDSRYDIKKRALTKTKLHILDREEEKFGG